MSTKYFGYILCLPSFGGHGAYPEELLMYSVSLHWIIGCQMKIAFCKEGELLSTSLSLYCDHIWLETVHVM